MLAGASPGPGLAEELSDHFRQAGDGRAPDVLGHLRNAGQRGVNAVSQLAEQARQQLVNPCTSRFRGEAVGFVSVGEFDEGAGTITYIGVAPDHRGQGYVDQLLQLANRTARELGFAGMLSDTDVLNVPMMEAFRRNSHSSETRGWHKWMHRRKV